MTRRVLGTALLVCVCACRQEAPPDVDAHLAALCAAPPTGLAVVDTEGLVSLDLPPKAVPIAMTVSLTLNGATVDGARVAGWPAPDGLLTALMEKRKAAEAQRAPTEEPAREDAAKEEAPAEGVEPTDEEAPARPPKFSAPVNLLINAKTPTEQIASMLDVLEMVGFDQAFLVVIPGGESTVPPAPDQALASDLVSSVRGAASPDARHEVLADALASETKSCDAVAEVFRDIAQDDAGARCAALQERLPAALASCETKVDVGRILTVVQVQLLPAGAVSGLSVELSQRGGFVSVPKVWTWADLGPKVVEYDGKPFRILAE